MPRGIDMVEIGHSDTPAFNGWQLSVINCLLPDFQDSSASDTQGLHLNISSSVVLTCWQRTSHPCKFFPKYVREFLGGFAVCSWRVSPKFAMPPFSSMSKPDVQGGKGGSAVFPPIAYSVSISGTLSSLYSLCFSEAAGSSTFIFLAVLSFWDAVRKMNMG